MSKKSSFFIIREKLGLSQNELADLLGMSRSLLAAAEDNRRGYSRKVDDKMAELMEMIKKDEASDPDIFPGADKDSQKPVVEWAKAHYDKSRYRLTGLERKKQKMIEEARVIKKALRVFEVIPSGQAWDSKEKRISTKWVAYHEDKKKMELGRYNGKVLLQLDLKIARLKAEIKILEGYT